MNKRLQLICLAGLIAAVPASAKKKKSAPATPAVAVKDSARVGNDYTKITKGATSKSGLFTTHLSKDNKLYFELPDSAFKHSYLLANRMAATSNTKDYVAGQMIGSPKMIRFSKDGQNVYMHLAQYRNTVDASDAMASAFDRNFIDPILKGFKIVARKDSSVVIDVTQFFAGNEKCISPLKPENPLVKTSTALKGTFSADGSNIKRVKTFPQNIEVAAS